MLSPGTIIGGRYEIISHIGSGGMSEVFKAQDLSLNRLVALKVLKSEFSSDVNFVSKFRMEAQNAAKLSHPNIVNVYDVGEENGIHYIIMELIQGITLKKYIERKKKLEIRESIEVAMQVARGIEAAHQQQIIHRDIKPQNIMISMEGKVKVTDFGIARAASSQTISSNTMGSVHYISPEQARGGYCDEKSDIYSLGITFYEMLTGRVPFEGESTVAVALMHIQSEIVPPTEDEPLIPISLEKIILKCTQKKPELRYPNATELIEDLKKSLTMPNGDFVKIPVLNTDSPTVIITEDDLDEIKRKRIDEPAPEETYVRPAGDRKKNSKDNYNRRRDYEDRRRDYEDYDDYDEYEDDPYDEDDYEDDYSRSRDRDRRKDRRRRKDYDYDDYDDGRSRFEKIITGISIAFAILVLIIGAIVFFKGCGISDEVPESTSAGATTEEQVPMVNLLGQTQADAIMALKKMKLDYKIETGTSDDYEIGQVYEQEFKEGEMLNLGTVVLLKVCAGPDSVSIPANLAGKTVSEVTSALKALGLKVSKDTRTEYSDDVRKGRVMDTDPAMGSAVSRNDVITLIISDGPETIYVVVPNLDGYNESNAIDHLRDSGLKPGRITYEDNDNVPEGRVIRQSISPGEEVEEGTSVGFVISNGSSKADVPDLRFSTLSDAKSQLTNNGLAVGNVTEEYSDESTRGLVIRQSISNGTSVNKGTRIDLVIGKGPEPTAPPTQAPQPTVPEHDPGENQDGGDPDAQ